ncbi:hypothetical protein GCM10011499_39700 [Pelagibacterium lentulum]|uniref:Uncharacterized protein n=1 Tax=Pelagibacterium lentulum TaxID=2029865 RepID=A0A916W4I9_9HYPH|nr:hypothetical protein GCM10011499_39700 [Pelagibacterium lentulum]
MNTSHPTVDEVQEIDVNVSAGLAEKPDEIMLPIGNADCRREHGLPASGRTRK